MGLQLPGELVTFLGWIGFTWPEADETKLFELGQAWLALAGELGAPAAAAEAAARAVWEQNHGEAVDAFRAFWEEGDSPGRNLELAAETNQLMGIAMIGLAGIVLALKINMIVQLVILAIEVYQAIATAVVTFGASLLEIPIFREITKLIVDQLVGLALNWVLGG